MIVAEPRKISEELLERRIVLDGVSWETYQELREANPGNHLRMTFDQGVLEFMSPSKKHEQISSLLGSMMVEWMMLRSIGAVFGGHTTFNRRDLLRGLEPDNCYWIAHYPQVLDKDEIDLLVDPPPDLALEVEVSRSSVPKLPIYQALGVPEVWRWRRGSLEVLILDSTGQYQSKLDSEALAGFPFKVAEEFIEMRDSIDNVALIKRFRAAIAASGSP
jgi:Uma2 family endonuclease